jgi:hypothetical protein
LAPEQKLQKLRELYADAPELGRVALENGLPALKKELAAATGVQSAGRKGARQGKVSEFALIFPLAKGGAKRLRGLLQMLKGNFQLADLVGTVHDMRFVFLDNDTKLLFATAYDGDWDPYIDVSATPWDGQGFGARRSETGSSSTRSQPKAGTSPPRI